MRFSRGLIAFITVLIIVSSLFAYAYLSYFSGPFGETWGRNLEEPTAIEPMLMVENNTLYWLGSYSSNYLLGSGIGLDIEAINITTGNLEWQNNVTVTNPGFSLYGTSNGQSVNTMPQLYWNNGDLILVTYTLSFRVGNFSQKIDNTSILMARFNPDSGSVLNYKVYNSTYESSGFPLALTNGSIYGSTTQQLGVTYYYNGILTGYFKIDVYGFSLSNSSHWNTSFYRQGNPTTPIIPIISSGKTLVIAINGISNREGYQGNTTFMGFNNSNGNIIWNYTASGSASDFYSSGNTLYFVNSSDNRTMLNSLNAQTGKPGKSFEIGSQSISYIQNIVVTQSNNTYSAYSFSGKKLWTSNANISTPDNYYTTLIGLSPGFALISTIGGNSYYHIINLTNGRMIWNRTYVPFSSLYSRNVNTAVPVLFSENYLISNIYKSNGNEEIIAANISSILS